jgi:hypothetical protein
MRKVTVREKVVALNSGSVRSTCTSLYLPVLSAQYVRSELWIGPKHPLHCTMCDIITSRKTQTNLLETSHVEIRRGKV